MDNPGTEELPRYDLEQRMAILRALAADPEVVTQCLDSGFSVTRTPDQVVDIGLTEPIFEESASHQSPLSALEPGDRSRVIAVAAQARTRGAAFCTLTGNPDADDATGNPVAVHIVNMMAEWGVLVCVAGGTTRPMKSDAARTLRAVAPRRIVQHRDESSTFLWIDEGSELLMGWDRQALVGTSTLDLLEPDDHERAIEGWLAMLADGQRDRVRLRYLTAEGEQRWFEVSQRNLLDDPAHGYVEVEMIDVHDEMVALAQARSGEQQFETLTESLPVGVLQVDSGGEIVYANRWMRAFIPETDGVRLENYEQLQASFQSVLRTGEPTDLDARLTEDGTGLEHLCRIRVRPLKDPDSEEHIGAIASIEDRTEMLNLQVKLQHQAHTDYLTGLANRAALMEWLDERLSHDVAESRRGTTLIFFDLDGFKRVNDGLGHDAGDRLLRIVADRARNFVRPQDMLARIGGDEFVIAHSSWLNDDACISLAERVIASFDEPIIVANTPTNVGCSVGIARSRTAGGSEALLENADIAMYEAKREGGRRWSRYDQSVRDRLEVQFQDERDVRQGLEQDEFTLYLQPIVDLTTGLAVGAEALIRWNHPSGGLLGPGSIISAAERSGLIHPLGQWVIEQACRLANRAAAELHGACRISINISGQQLTMTNFHDQLLGTIERTGTDASQLILEITETAFVDTNDEIMFMLADLTRAGVTIALDDFGTGFSSLNHLRLMPAQMVKIDGSYTADLGVDSGTTAITETMVALTEALGQELVVEGIEEPHQLSRVKNMGVSLGQGFLLARPMPETEFFAIDRTATPVDAHTPDSIHARVVRE